MATYAQPAVNVLRLVHIGIASPRTHFFAPFFMTYEESFLSTCDAEGNAPEWAIEQIFEEHGSDLADFAESLPFNQSMFNGEAILNWLGY